ncbi:MAG: Penicillin-binding protein 2, partial [Candidatus Woesebacteria bacterium GW2011_GWB1_40_12]
MHPLSSVKSQSWLAWFLRGILILLFLILFAKLIEVQVIKGNYYKNLSKENRIRRVIIPAPRGKILARGGEVLAGNIEVKKSIEFTDNGGFVLSEDLTKSEDGQLVNDYKRYYPLEDKFSHALGYMAQVGEKEVGKINPDCPEKGPRRSDSLMGKT